MSASNETIERAVSPHVGMRGLAVYDIEFSGAGRTRVLRITVSPGLGGDRTEGVDIDLLAALTRTLDPVLEELIDGSFQLEVSSPGLERTLRRPEHYATARGERVSVKFTPADGATIRELGLLVDANADTIELLTDQGVSHTIPMPTISAAHTVFEWGPTPRPGKGSKPGAKKQPQKERTS